MHQIVLREGLSEDPGLFLSINLEFSHLNINMVFNELEFLQDSVEKLTGRVLLKNVVGLCKFPQFYQ